MKRIRFCEKCKVYTMQEVCKKCGSRTKVCSPPKYRENDPYAKYRRAMLYG